MKQLHLLNLVTKHFKYSKNAVHTSCNVFSNKSVHVHESEPSEAAQPTKEKIKGPFIKNLFLGLFDPEMLVYPEYSSKEDLMTVVNRIRPVQDFFLHVNDSKLIDENAEIPETVLDFLKENKAFSLQVPHYLEGLNVEHKEFAKFLEAVGPDVSVTTMLTVYNRVLNALLSYGTEAQKLKYVTKLSSREWIPGFAIVENICGLDMAEISLTAVPKDDKSWALSGKKIWVANGDKADFFLVFAKTWVGTIKQADATHSTVFIVDKTSPGVTCGPPIQQLGARGVSICDVTFNETIVSEENILGSIGSGYDIALSCLSKGRLGSGAAAAGLLKRLLEMITEYLIHTETMGKPLIDYELFKLQLGKAAVDIYALESIAYLTAGVLDTYDNPDCAMEEHVVKLFSVEKSLEIINMCTNLIGGQSFIKDSPLERYIRDAYAYLMHDIVPIDITKLYIATHGIQHAGLTLKETVKKARNPLEFPSFAVKHILFHNNALKDEPKLPKQLRLQVHPSLGPEADKIEHCVIRIEFVAKEIMTRWGREILDRQRDLISLTDCVMSVYAMTAVLGRASRAYCIGLQNAQFDAVVANTFCHLHHKRVLDITERLIQGPLENGNAGLLKIGEQVVKSKGYCFDHPLSRNY